MRSGCQMQRLLVLAALTSTLVFSLQVFIDLEVDQRFLTLTLQLCWWLQWWQWWQWCKWRQWWQGATSGSIASSPGLRCGGVVGWWGWWGGGPLTHPSLPPPLTPGWMKNVFPEMRASASNAQRCIARAVATVTYMLYAPLLLFSSLLFSSFS